MPKFYNNNKKILLNAPPTIFIFSIFTDSVLLAGSVIESSCPSVCVRVCVCVGVCVSVCLCYRKTPTSGGIGNLWQNNVHQILPCDRRTKKEVIKFLSFQKLKCAKSKPQTYGRLCVKKMYSFFWPVLTGVSFLQRFIHICLETEYPKFTTLWTHVAQHFL